MALVNDWSILGPALWVTAQNYICGAAPRCGGRGCAAVVLAQSRWIETLLSPVMVTLQVTPIVAIAPLILSYAQTPWIAQLICAFLVTFFPIILNTL
ncbi:ABC transporter permease subunit [Rhizobium sp. 007]|uniref:ABC transporter permease subunit n=1 Tax=Rhizobium sp. 007 TaxID=2785056 RepID=UPI00188F2DCC|nr:ABC transporter permease subunit [Rhizobium sp. 007]QPB20206.1 hypothetical protein ISN39_01390 [Rhizobium sp. 007]